MMRCIGMSKKQIKKFVILDALNWCRKTIPLGIGLGLLVSWILAFILKYLVAEEFSSIQVL